MYWTPDNSCYEIKIIYEAIKLAFLKDNGEGIRFKIRAELSELPEYEPRHSRHETYLYFIDNRFCEKGFIDERYEHGNKKYIPVTLDIFPNGDYELLYFQVDDSRYIVEKTITKEPRGSYFAGGIGVKHRVEARLVNPHNDDDAIRYKTARRQAALYWELNKWFVACSHQVAVS